MADPGFLEWGFICIKRWGFALPILSHFSYISHEYETEIKLFHLHRIFKNGGGGGGGGGGGSSEPPLDPPLIFIFV